MLYGEDECLGCSRWSRIEFPFMLHTSSPRLKCSAKLRAGLYFLLPERRKCVICHFGLVPVVPGPVQCVAGIRVARIFTESDDLTGGKSCYDPGIVRSARIFCADKRGSLRWTETVVVVEIRITLVSFGSRVTVASIGISETVRTCPADVVNYIRKELRQRGARFRFRPVAESPDLDALTECYLVSIE